MKTTAFVILSFIVIPFVYDQKKVVRKRTSETTTFYDKGDGKIRSTKRTDNYVVYDKQGREMEYATYGEVSESTRVSEDGNVIINDQWDNSRIFTNDFTTYDNSGRKIRMDTWLYHDNRKNYLLEYSIFKYADGGLLVKQQTFTEKDSLKEIVTFIYDKKSNNIEIIDSSFNKYPGAKLSIARTESQFDTLKRMTLKTMFSDGKLLFRKKFLYDYNNIIEMRYDKENENSLWSETEATYSTSNQSSGSKLKSEECWQTGDSVETDEIYFRDADGLLKKIETYSKGELTAVTKFSYKYY